jgi:hypothetical protein
MISSGAAVAQIATGVVLLGVGAVFVIRRADISVSINKAREGLLGGRPRRAGPRSMAGVGTVAIFIGAAFVLFPTLIVLGVLHR